jgi:MtN3 and saliva related transmembrane protein
MSLLGWVGTLAACCTTFAFVPQIVKIRRQGGDDLSYAMLSFYLTGILLWLAYGLLLHAAAVIWANAATAFLVAVAIVLKATHPSRAARKRAALRPAAEATPETAETAASSKFVAPLAS